MFCQAYIVSDDATPVGPFNDLDEAERAAETLTTQWAAFWLTPLEVHTMKSTNPNKENP